MGLVYRRSRRIGKRGRINTGSGGVSGSYRAGRVTINSRGRGRVRLGKGFGWVFRWK